MPLVSSTILIIWVGNSSDHSPAKAMPPRRPPWLRSRSPHQLGNLDQLRSLRGMCDGRWRQLVTIMALYQLPWWRLSLASLTILFLKCTEPAAGQQLEGNSGRLNFIKNGSQYEWCRRWAVLDTSYASVQSPLTPQPHLLPQPLPLQLISQWPRPALDRCNQTAHYLRPMPDISCFLPLCFSENVT